jgi:hypothetical protein
MAAYLVAGAKRQDAFGASTPPGKGCFRRGRLKADAYGGRHPVTSMNERHDPSGSDPPAPDIAAGAALIVGREPGRYVRVRLGGSDQGREVVEEDEVDILVQGLQGTVAFLAHAQRPIILAQPSLDRQFTKKRLLVAARIAAAIGADSGLNLGEQRIVQQAPDPLGIGGERMVDQGLGTDREPDTPGGWRHVAPGGNASQVRMGRCGHIECIVEYRGSRPIERINAIGGGEVIGQCKSDGRGRKVKTRRQQLIGGKEILQPTERQLERAARREALDANYNFGCPQLK